MVTFSVKVLSRYLIYIIFGLRTDYLHFTNQFYFNLMRVNN
jgi:hypothetical protein